MVQLARLLCAIRLQGHGILNVDRVRFTVRGGYGGAGLEQLGGVGGAGGDVYLKAVSSLSLEKFQKMQRQRAEKRFIADVGTSSSKRLVLGKKASDLIIKVPVGVTVTGKDGALLADLNRENDQILVAQGGMGGCPVTNYKRAKGTSQVIQLDLKLIADIGLVGFPNAGKSSLLHSISRAKPKIAAYPFTTIKPQVGTLEYEDFRQISMADLPGLIEGAYRNVGMGHKFLKHVERTSLLLLMVDIEGFQLNSQSTYRTAIETVALLNKELELYNDELLNKPAVLCLNKTDLSDVGEIEQTIKMLKDADFIETLPEDIRPERWLNFEEIFAISAKYGHEMDNLKQRLREVLDYVDDIKQNRLPYTSDLTLSHEGTLI